MNKSFSKILAVVIFAIFILGGIISWEYWYLRSKAVKTPEEKEEEIKLSEEVTREMIEKNAGAIINKVLALHLDRNHAEYFIDDLNNDGLLEIIITACPPTAQP